MHGKVGFYAAFFFRLWGPERSEGTGGPRGPVGGGRNWGDYWGAKGGKEGGPPGFDSLALEIRRLSLLRNCASQASLKLARACR